MLLFIVGCLELSGLLSSPLVQVDEEGVSEALVGFPLAHKGGVSRWGKGLFCLSRIVLPEQCVSVSNPYGWMRTCLWPAFSRCFATFLLTLIQVASWTEQVLLFCFLLVVFWGCFLCLEEYLLPGAWRDYWTVKIILDSHHACSHLLSLKLWSYIGFVHSVSVCVLVHVFAASHCLVQ